MVLVPLQPDVTISPVSLWLKAETNVAIHSSPQKGGDPCNLTRLYSVSSSCIANAPDDVMVPQTLNQINQKTQKRTWQDGSVRSSWLALKLHSTFLEEEKQLHIITQHHGLRRRSKENGPLSPGAHPSRFSPRRNGTKKKPLGWYHHGEGEPEVGRPYGFGKWVGDGFGVQGEASKKTTLTKINMVAHWHSASSHILPTGYPKRPRSADTTCITLRITSGKLGMYQYHS